MDRKQQRAAAEAIAAVCDEGQGAVLDMEGPLAELYAELVRSGSDAARTARATVGAWSDGNSFTRVRECAHSVAAGNAGWSAETGGKRLPRACADILADDDLLWNLSHLMHELGDAAPDDLRELADAALSARERAVAALAEL